MSMQFFGADFSRAVHPINTMSFQLNETGMQVQKKNGHNYTCIQFCCNDRVAEKKAHCNKTNPFRNQQINMKFPRWMLLL